jgi:hypothetical protein
MCTRKSHREYKKIRHVPYSTVVDPDPVGSEIFCQIWIRIRNECEKNLFNKIHNFSTKCTILKQISKTKNSLKSFKLQNT